MKLLITTDNIGGVWTFTLNLTRELVMNGIEVHVAVTGLKMTGEQKRELEFTSWSFTPCRQEWMEAQWDDQRKAGDWLLMLKNLFKPDIVHLNSYFFGALPWEAPLVITAHSCVLSWKEAVREAVFDNTWLSDYRIRITKGLRHADAVVAPSNTLMASITKLYGPFKESRIIYNGTDHSTFKVSSKKEYIFCMGRLWDAAKNIKLVLEAAPLINYEVFIAGEMNEEISEKELPGNVHLTGKLTPDEVTMWLSEAAIYLLPVRYEPFGYTFLEAALSSCAIITGDIPSMHEIWQDAAEYADPADSLNLANVVNLLMSDRKRRLRMAEKARRRASEFTAERMAEGYITLYRELTGRAGEHRGNTQQLNIKTIYK